MGCLIKWRMSRVVTVLMVSALVHHIEGSTCKIPNGPECFKAESESPDYRCEWKPSEYMRNATYQLFIQTVIPKYHLYPSDSVTGQNYVELRGEELIKKRAVNIWVVAHMGNESCRSPNNTVILQETVKYKPPQDISMARSSNSLVLRWASVEGKGHTVEVKYQRLDDPEASWNYINISTKANGKTVSVTLDLQQRSAYKALVRQRGQKPIGNPLWSDWSQVLDIPTEIKNPPNASLIVEDLYNGTRSLRLTWDGSQYVSAGRVSYHLSIHDWPCQKIWKSLSGKMEWTVRTAPEFRTSVTYSAVNLSITAANKMGSSPPTYFLVPAQHLKTCSDTPAQQKQDRDCLEWYMLADGETRPTTVNVSNGTLEIRENMRDYVRYYYFRHSLSERTQLKTTEMCPIYKKEDAPSKAPTEFTFFNVTHNSVVLNWKPIPVAELRGFLKHYEVCVTTSSNERRACHSVSASQTEYLLENLTPKSIYQISLAGVTIAEGPKATVDIETLSQPINVGIIIACMAPVLAVTVMCSFLVNRFKSKLFPPVPVPVLIDPVIDRKKILSWNELKEEVHEFTIEQLMLPDKMVQIPDLTMLCTLLDPSDPTQDPDPEEEEGSVGTPTPLDECVPLSPDYRGQVRADLGDIQMTHQTQNESDCEAAMLVYRNGLVFDMTANSTENVGTPL